MGTFFQASIPVNQYEICSGYDNVNTMKGTPPYPGDDSFYICCIQFTDQCFEQDLNVDAAMAISYNS